MCAVKMQDNNSGVIKSESPHRVESVRIARQFMAMNPEPKLHRAEAPSPTASALGSPVVATQKRQ
jgi:hypothetical protein